MHRNKTYVESVPSETSSFVISMIILVPSGAVGILSKIVELLVKAPNTAYPEIDNVRYLSKGGETVSLAKKTEWKS